MKHRYFSALITCKRTSALDILRDNISNMLHIKYGTATAMRKAHTFNHKLGFIHILIATQDTENSELSIKNNIEMELTESMEHFDITVIEHKVETN